MEYFHIFQDKRYHAPPLIADFFPAFRRQNFCEERKQKIADFNVVFTKSQRASESLDFLDEQLILVSEEIHEVFEIYERSMEYKVFCILNNKFGQYFYYFAPIFPVVDCILPESFSPDNARRIDHIVLDKTMLGKHYIFKAKLQDKDIIILRLEVLESLLRRGIKKFCYESVQAK